MKVRYPIRYQEGVEPPTRRVGSVPRWKDVTDQLEELAESGGVLTISVPLTKVPKEIKSLRNAIYRARKQRGIEHRYSVQIADEGIKVWRMREEDADNDVSP